MLFDEPTAHLDIETEHDIKRLILPLMANKLVFFATHRLHWMREMDIILVIENGKIVESGTHQELLARKGAYFQLIEAQRGGIMDETLSKIYFPLFKTISKLNMVNDSFWFINRYRSFNAYLYIRIPHFSYGPET